MKITAIIPAKENSKRLSHKNLLEIDNHSLVYLACEKCLNSKLITDVYIDTESEKILENIKSLTPLGLKVINRPIELATNETSGNDLIKFELKHIEPCDIILHTYSTSPLITTETIDYSINYFIKGQHCCDSFFSATVFQEYIWLNGKPVNFDHKTLPNSFELPKYFKETHGLYGIKYEVARKFNRRLGNNVLPIIIPKIEEIDINDYEDYKLAKLIYNNRKK
jgi:CMP-N-acetylneuraminic acid synthetase